MSATYDCDLVNLDKKKPYAFVYKTDDLLAFKYMISDAQYGLENLNDIDILNRLNHPHILHSEKILTFLNCQIENVAIILPLFDCDLKSVIIRDSLLIPSKIAIIYKLAKGLEFLHENRILHLDITPSNIMLQKDQPYFINFNFSLSMDDIVKGKSDKFERVTIDHRAPELKNSKHFNVAVDIWAFGITILKFIKGDNYLFGNWEGEANYWQTLEKNFVNDRFLNDSLSHLANNYRGLFSDLLGNMLKMQPEHRLTAKQIVQHKTFDKSRNEIMGEVMRPGISYQYATDQREIIKLIFHWIKPQDSSKSQEFSKSQESSKNIFSECGVELLFLAVDLFNRCGSFYAKRDTMARGSVAAACIWMAYKLINGENRKLSEFIPLLIEKIPNISSKDIVNYEIEIIHHLEGILNVNSLYKACRDEFDLNKTLDYILLSKDSTLYAKTDITNWILELDQVKSASGYISNNDKNILIKDFLK